MKPFLRKIYRAYNKVSFLHILVFVTKQYAVLGDALNFQ